MHLEKGGKGAKGGNGGKGGFDGYCNYCWAYGHRLSKCWKKDQEMDKLLNQLIDLEDAVEQQIAVKVSFEFIS